MFLCQCVNHFINILQYIYLQNKTLIMYLLPQNARRAKNILIAFYVTIAMQLISLLSNFMQLALLRKVEKGDYNASEATTNDARQAVIAFSHVGLYIVSIVLFILWFRRAYNNLYLSNRASTNFETGWAAGAWFVPFLNLGRPYSIMKEIWIKTQQATDNLLTYKPADIVGWWWALWIANNIAANIATRAFKGSTVEDLTNLTYANMVSDIVELAAVILAIMMIKQTAVFEENLQQSLLVEKQPEGDDVLNFIVNS